MKNKISECIEALNELASNLWWSWQPGGHQLWAQLDQDLWTQTFHSPKALLKTLDGRLQQCLENEDLQYDIIKWRDRCRQSLSDQSTWHQQANKPCEGGVVYFCSEYGLHESIATYSGGLGILAGDHVKSASDLGLPFIGVGLLYRNGYVQQRLTAQGEQIAEFHTFDFDNYPAELQLDESGNALKVTAPLLDGTSCQCQIWSLSVGRVNLYLLDADISENNDEARSLTSKLYGGNHLTRIQQELILGVGGIRALRALNINPKVYHLNEGHSSFLNLERLREFKLQGLSYEDSLAQIRASSVFTTHTPVEAGHDRFDVDTAWRGLEWFANEMSMSRDEVLALGHWPDESDSNALFNMTLLAMHTCKHLNGVAALHAEVSREMFQRFWPETELNEVPITSVTNGVHAPTWQADPIRSLLQEHMGGLGAESWPEESTWSRVEQISNQELWAARCESRQALIDLGRQREAARRERLGLPAWQDQLDPETLTIGFARRFATYKRANLIFSEMERLLKIIETAPGPIQLFFAGKAHPADLAGQALVKAVYEASQHPALQGRVLLIEDYDIEVGRAMVQGADVWLNNPRRPKEASGTSGMKVAMNGGLNLSILDGWWPEGFNGDNGWSIGEEKTYHDTQVQDREDALSLYDRLENDVIPCFYDRDAQGYPQQWLKMSKSAIASCTPQFHSNRQVRDYIQNLYQAALVK
ncbi:MAG: alpha-glucan phosphorylase [Myxococcales bacterium]|nr:alpha-glucan phosphorylase [Myxococcales bacterium]